ncbi:hypothetical protein AB1Y20_019325 [Prymnesium parvum]|uniref:Transcriptional regulator n=1 Tax=Prymnesium parvum TaxID=97485 RepID=A0AB34JRF7_PRYPA
MRLWFAAACALACSPSVSAVVLTTQGRGGRLCSARRSAAIRLQEGESLSDDEERDEVNDFRAQLLRQFGGDGGSPAASSAAEGSGGAPKIAKTLAAGQVLLAHPKRFCSSNPFARPVKDMNRFGLQGPVSGMGMPPDVKAQMLPVLLLIEHGSSGSTALLMERRTGALMGDISMEDYGCVAISPLWLGGTAKQSSLFVIHDVDDIERSTQVREGLWLGGWTEAKPRVAESALAEGRFKFFLGATEWGPGQLEQELESGAWLALDCSPELVIKDRVMGWQPGKPKPVWTELVGMLGDEAKGLMEMVYQADDDA